MPTPQTYNNYHPDHLGSASWITNFIGTAVQNLAYLPYGETRVNQHPATYNERYTFSGKEKDPETGYHYFGARYYNSDLSLWLSVDPMSDKYPSLSPYNYCAWNPMKLVDPDGDSIILSKEAWEIMNQAIKSTLHVEGDDSPFYYENGYMLYDSEKTYSSKKPDQQEIFSHLKELVTATNFNVSVSVVGNDTKFSTYIEEAGGNDFVERSMKDLKAYGFTQLMSNKRDCNVYISNEPLRADGRKYVQQDDYKSISILHEVGGHSYYYMNGVMGGENCSKTEQFEQKCRNVFNGRFGSPDIPTGGVSRHSRIY